MNGARFCLPCIGRHDPATGTKVTDHKHCDGGGCGCAAEGHLDLRYATHGDPYSDPPRAVVCRRCGALVGNTGVHDDWHGVPDPFGCDGDVDHEWQTTVVTNSVARDSRSLCLRCGAVHDDRVALSPLRPPS